MEFCLLAFSFCLCIVFFFNLKKHMKMKNTNLPPSPPTYPIIGHLHLLKAPIYRTLQNLSYKYGPIFSLKLGSIPVLVVSSPQLLEECFTINDVIFANRPQFLIAKHMSYNFSTMGSANYGPHWRNLRRVSALEFFSANRLNAYLAIRKEEMIALLKNMVHGGESVLSYKRVQMRSKLLELAFNITMRMASGKRYFGADVENFEEAKRFRDIISETLEVSEAGQPNDFFKLLQWIDFKGYEKKLANLQIKTDAFLQNLVDEIRNKRKKSGVGQNSRSYIDTMLSLQENEPNYYTDDLIKGNTMLLLIGGTDTSSLTIEWAMSLLLNHPEVLNKARSEIDKNIGHNNLVEEEDLSKLPYLQCIMNETLRLFPVVPLLVPHISSADCIVGGFNIPRGTTLMPNVWALHRDPNVWDDPTTFKPERFEGPQNYGYKYMPFGMGRRHCPGTALANRMVNFSLAVLIQCFEWERPNEELIDLSEGHGITLPKEKPLEFMCKPREQMVNILSQL